MHPYASYLRIYGAVNELRYALLAEHVRSRIKQLHVLSGLQCAGSCILISLAAFTATLRRV